MCFEILKVQEYKIIFLTIPGAFTPVTMEGNIIVDGVLTSCYASASHDLAHI